MIRNRVDKKTRKGRLARNVAGVLLLVMLYYISSGCPAFSAEDRFRREELAQGIGPAEIHAHISMDNYTVYRERIAQIDDMGVILASDDYGAIVYTYREDTKRQKGTLLYREKTDGVVLCAVPGMLQYSDVKELEYPIKVPLILFDNVPDAVRAELEITLRAYQYSWSSAYEELYSAFANREGEGYFLFSIEPRDDLYKRHFYRAIEDMCDRHGDGFYVDAEGNATYNPTTYTVNFYDQDRNVIATYSGKIQSLVGEAHMERS